VSAGFVMIANKAVEFWDCIIGAPKFVMQRENAVYKIRTKTGFAALRIHRPDYHSRIEIESELQWMAHLAQSNLQVPIPYQTRNGTFLAEVEGDQRQVFILDLLSWIEGEPLGKSRVPLTFSKDSLKHIFFDLGCNLALMHHASDQWKLPNNFQRHALDKEGLLGDTAAWGKFWEASCLTSDERQLLIQARNWATEKIDLLSTGGADYGLIHADLVRENILIANGKTRFIDFDDAGFGFRMFDLATALIKNREEPHYHAMKDALIAGYRSRRRLTPADEHSINFFLTLRDFAYLGWADARREEPSMTHRISQIKQDTLMAAQVFLNQSSLET
jgi:Ser/Thr protein kinase RdoA (MazF antagonist)